MIASFFLPFAAGPITATAKSPKSNRPPNILFLLTDDQRPDTIRALGNPIIETPNLDALVRAGTTFTRAISPYPLCHPSRAEILTGCSAFQNGINPGHSNTLNPNLTLLPQAFQSAGYQTVYVGKWHTVGRPSTRGYDVAPGLFAAGRGKPEPTFDQHGRKITGYVGWMFQTDDRRLFPEKGVGLTPTIDARFADAAIQFIRQKHQKPFFLHVNFTAPHDPLLVAPAYRDKYDPETIPLPPNFRPQHPFDHGNLKGRDELLLPFPRTKQIVRRELADYYAVISHMDEQVGRILAALDHSPHTDNTIVVFTSDHGLAIGSHGLRGKQNMYEHTLGVPLILRGPNIPENKRTPAQAYLRDLYPTLCDLAAISTPPSVQAKSLAPILSGKKQTVRESTFAYFTDTQRMIRTDSHKLIHYLKLDKYQLFDLTTDPHEQTDLAPNPDHAQTLAPLKTQLRAHQKAHNDPALNL